MMLKHEARKQVQDRASTRYPKSVVMVLAKLIDLTRVDDWKLDQVENFFSSPTSASKIGFLTNLERHTVNRALKVLMRDGVIRADQKTKDSYSINPETLKTFASKYLTTRTRTLEQKILNTIRMKFTRRGFPEKALTPEWASIHPVQCACLPLFCSHPNTV